jgi:uncharacterized DUF497 family protein
MRFVFEWDLEKAKIDFEKHGVRFEEGMNVFDDEYSITCYDYTHSEDEDRFLDIGVEKNGKVLVVCYTERDDHIRIIHARKANKEERRFYENEKKK